MRDERRPDAAAAEADDRHMVAVQEGDLARLGVLFERHHRALFNFFLRLTGDRQASEDLVQDVFFRMLKYRATYQPGTSFRTWMYHLARNAHIDRFKGRRREALYEDGEGHEPMSHQPQQDEEIARDQQVVLLREAMARLPEDKRELLVLARFQGLKYEQIGRLLGCETGAVKVRVFRAVGALREIDRELSGDDRPCNATTL